MTGHPTTPVAAWRRPMVVVAVAALALCLIMGSRQTFGLFLQPITSDLGWGRETFALSMAVTANA